MALMDYKLCENCGAKVFYDANVTYPDGVKVAALCAVCSFDFELVAIPLAAVEDDEEGGAL